MHELGWGLCGREERVMLRCRRGRWRQPRCRTRGSLVVPSSAPWLQAGGTLPFQAAPSSAKPHVQEEAFEVPRQG